jgi:hypothetical protein
MATQASCENLPGNTRESCTAISVHIEFEVGSDSETIRIHAYYSDTKLNKSSADVVSTTAKISFSKLGPKWLKWERRDNGGSIESMK